MSYDYEQWPYKDIDGCNLDIGDLVKFHDASNISTIYRIVIFTLDAKKAVIQAGHKQWTVPTNLLRWIR